MSLLASVNNECDVRRLQQAALIQDRGLRKSGRDQWWQKGGGWKRWGKQSVHVTAHAAGEDTSDDDGPAKSGAHFLDDDLVECHSEYLAYQSAKGRYREAMRSPRSREAAK